MNATHRVKITVTLLKSIKYKTLSTPMSHGMWYLTKFSTQRVVYAAQTLSLKVIQSVLLIFNIPLRGPSGQIRVWVTIGKLYNYGLRPN